MRGRGAIDDETWEELEDTLLLADVGMPTTEQLLERVRDRARRARLADAEALIGALHAELVALLRRRPDRARSPRRPGEPNVWMFVGVNGVGKTTTIAKVAQREIDDGRRSCSPPPTRSAPRRPSS